MQKMKYSQQLIGFFKDSRSELKRIVWPSRPETTQMTIIVLVMVTLLSFFLWVIDSIVLKVIGWMIGYGLV